MLKPRKVKFWAQKKESENLRFRAFLKINADEEELDRQFLELHKELFSDYDCSKCRNCCKLYAGCIPAEDLEKDADALNMTQEEFIKKFLIPADSDGMYQTLHMPCDFLQENGDCILGECKPENCQKFPYTDQPERLASLLSVLDAVEVCPVAFELVERLKGLYGFERK